MGKHVRHLVEGIVSCTGNEQYYNLQTNKSQIFVHNIIQAYTFRHFIFLLRFRRNYHHGFGAFDSKPGSGHDFTRA